MKKKSLVGWIVPDWSISKQKDNNGEVWVMPPIYVSEDKRWKETKVRITIQEIK